MKDGGQAPTIAELVAHYDRSMYGGALAGYFGGSDFTNFGWWDETVRTQREACERLMERLLALVPGKRGRVLDVACGKGATTAYLGRYYGPEQVTAINISQRQLETCRVNVPGCRVLVMDAARLGFGEETFENVVCVEAAFHFDTREAFLREAYRVLKPGGRLVLTDMLMTLEAERRRPLRTEKNYLASPEAYRALCERVGFREVAVMDATEPCWRGCYRYVVRFAHEKLLAGTISLREMEELLNSVYGHVPDITYYLLVVAGKGA